MRSTSNIGQDEVGFFAYWGADWRTRRETLRTKKRTRAERWLIQGNCHGADAHHKSCPYCQKVANEADPVAGAVVAR